MTTEVVQVIQGRNTVVSVLGGASQIAVDASAATVAAAADAAASAVASAASATAAGVSATASSASASAAATSAAASAVSAADASAARDAAIAGSILTWPTTAAGVGTGIAGVTSIVGGSGGTNGTFALAYTGGTQVLAPVGVFTVAGGALVSVVITYPGYYSAGTPTLSFAASTGLTGASATAQMAANTPVNGFFVVPSAVTGEAYIVYKNVAGVATEQVRTPSTATVATNGTDILSLQRTVANALMQTANIFNKDDPNITTGYFVNNTTGALQANASYEASGWIPVSASTAYYFSTQSYLAWYNSAKTYISGVTTSVANAQTSPAGAAYLRCTIPKVSGLSAVGSFYVTLGSSPLSAYVGYGGKVALGAVSGLVTGNMAAGGVGPSAMSFLTATKNLFNKDGVTVGSYVAANGTPVVDAQYSYSALMPVTAGAQYICNKNMRFYAAYDASGTVVPASGSNTQVNAGTAITIPGGIAYLRITVVVADVSGAQFEAGTAVTGFMAFGYTLSSQILISASGSVSAWANKTLACLGDSLTAQAKFLDPTAAALSLIVTNYGVGGTKIAGAAADAMWQDARVNAIPTTVDAVHLLGGTNDWANNGALGPTTSTTTTDFYGALNVLAAKMAARWPTKPIFWGTAPLSAMTLPRSGFTDTYTNGVGLTMLDYAEAVRVVAKKWGFIIVDYALDAGFNSANLTSYMTNDGNYIHPNTDGGKRMSAVQIGRMKALEPIA
jgi:GDSL-like Lipase/Acylhydrolase family